MPTRLTRVTMLEAVDRLSRCDPDLARILRLHGPPPLWARPAGFPTLIKIILEQQVSLASARSAFERLTQQTQALTPESVQALGSTRLRALGLTRQKTRYVLELARAIQDGRVDLRQIGRADDNVAREALMIVPGIGSWTADIYLLMALRREDVWPVGDLALRSSIQQLHGMRRVPSSDAIQKIALKWRPHRSVAARLLWNYYLASRLRR